MPTPTKLERYRGSLLGLATGDAVGMTLEFCRPGNFEPIDDMVGGGFAKLAAGQWSDDTSMALCLAASLIECRGFNAKDQMKRYLRWYKEGYLSSVGRCFDIGTTTLKAIQKFQQSGNPMAGDWSAKSAGNGSIMRLAPIPLYFAATPLEAIQAAAESSRTTHGATTCLDACRYLSAILVGAALGLEKDTLLASRFSPVADYWSDFELCDEIDAIACGSFKTKNPPEIKGSGYVVESLEAALWAFYNSSTFKEGCLLAVNLGDDADTTAAVYGQLAGAYYGETGIPENWRAKLTMREKIESFADSLYKLAWI
jgi:ADP-ribosyl-[dinitrogen reductase] hydrolase